MTLGKYKLAQHQIMRLGRGSSHKVNLEQDNGPEAINRSSEAMTAHNFPPFKPQGTYLVSSAQNNFIEQAHVG